MFDNDLEKLLSTKFAKPNITIRQHTDDLLRNAEILWQLGYLDTHIYDLLKICCEYHDYGKMNEQFQTRVSSEKKIKFDDGKEVAHNVLSLCLICKEIFKNVEDYHRSCYAVLNHHHYVNNFEEAEVKEKLINEFTAKYGGQPVGRRLLRNLNKQKNDNQAIILKGLLHKCDYAASGSYKIEYKNDFLLDSLNQNLLPNFSDGWNELQNFCIENRDENIIAIANTGMGKTEAGLLWIGNNKGFFILPLRKPKRDCYGLVIIKDSLSYL